MNATIRVGIVGAGFFGALIAAACDRHEEFTVRAVADAVPEAASTLASRYDAIAVTDAATLASRDDIDLVVVATPNHLHTEPALAALAAGKNVFVEKPIAIDRESIGAIATAAAASQGQLIVGHVMRSMPGVTRMVRDARAGGLGRVLEASGARRRLVRVPNGAGSWWKLDRSKSGGELLHEIHELDLIVWALGSPLSVHSASGAPMLPDAAAPTDTDTVTTLVFPSGAIGTHLLSTSSHRAEWWFRIAGTEATLEADFRTGVVSRYVDGRVVATSGIFDDLESNQSLRDSAEQAQAYNSPGSEGPLWMRTAVDRELDDVAGAVHGTSTVLTESPTAAALAAITADETSGLVGVR